jgi:hypothetical protein
VCILNESFVADLIIQCLDMVMQMDVKHQVCFKISQIIQTRSIMAATENRVKEKILFI